MQPLNHLPVSVSWGFSLIAEALEPIRIDRSIVDGIYTGTAITPVFKQWPLARRTRMWIGICGQCGMAVMKLYAEFV